MRSELGEGIRSQRERLGLSLRAVASAVGISPSMLSQVETGKLSPSVSTLYEIATYLEVSVDALLGLKSADEASLGATVRGSSARVRRAEDHPPVKVADGVTWERLAKGREGQLGPILVTYAPGTADSPERKMTRRPGVEFGYILEGELTMSLGFQQTVLRPGDSFCFDAEVPHLFLNDTEQPARAIWFILESWDGDGDHRGLGGFAHTDVVKVLRTGI